MRPASTLAGREDLVDQGEEVEAGAVDVARELLDGRRVVPAGRERAEEQLREADDRVERGPELVG